MVVVALLSVDLVESVDLVFVDLVVNCNLPKTQGKISKNLKFPANPLPCICQKIVRKKPWFSFILVLWPDFFVRFCLVASERGVATYYHFRFHEFLGFFSKKITDHSDIGKYQIMAKKEKTNDFQP